MPLPVGEKRKMGIGGSKLGGLLQVELRPGPLSARERTLFDPGTPGQNTTT